MCFDLRLICSARAPNLLCAGNGLATPFLWLLKQLLMVMHEAAGHRSAEQTYLKSGAFQDECYTYRPQLTWKQALHGP